METEESEESSLRRERTELPAPRGVITLIHNSNTNTNTNTNTFKTTSLE